MTAAGVAGLITIKPATAAPYVPVIPGVDPVGSPILPVPSIVPGKEFSEGGPLGTGPDRDSVGGMFKHS